MIAAWHCRTRVELLAVQQNYAVDASMVAHFRTCWPPRAYQALSTVGQDVAHTFTAQTVKIDEYSKIR